MYRDGGVDRRVLVDLVGGGGVERHEGQVGLLVVDSGIGVLESVVT